MRPVPRGFTLVEMIVVIVITGIVAAVVALFLKTPVEGYLDLARRTELTDIADGALRRMARDVRLALPNSLRVTDGGKTLEFLITRTGGRYRAEGPGDWLDFSIADTSLDVLGTVTMQTGDKIAIYNLGPNVTGANAYAGDNITAYTGGAGSQSNVSIAAKKFPLPDPASRFFVVEGPVSYVCDTAARTLTRYWGYAIQPAQPTAASLPGLAGVQSALLASRVTECSFRYLEGVTEPSGLLELVLALEDGGEKITLYHEVHVEN